MKLCTGASWEGGLTLIAFIDITLATISVIASAALFTVPGLYNTVQEIFYEFGDYQSPDELQFTVWAIFITLLIVSSLIYLAIEVVLFLTLREATSNRSYSLCHKWFYIRISLLIFSIAFSIYRISVLEYSPYDAVFEPLKFYRAIELVFVSNFMSEIKREQKGLSRQIIEQIIRSSV
ncbi:uncharacterized protein LOC110847606 [Folsomia candida]|uniref:Uncharacterized protein n=1 Tax=Folsomia candida TaxID=158441 RepID=A0A226EMI0_FOLCA|nr:uncharacterized protein LOC110847606 [Folsomia candida]OXA58408.1 hypothetical protein Fcan01_07777 [Folsomia candida]